MNRQRVGFGLLFSLATGLALCLGVWLALSWPGEAQAQAVSISGACATDLFFSEYVEGSSFNKALEIYNTTGVAVDLAAGNYTLERYNNGSSSASATINLTGVIADGDVFVIAHPDADPAILAEADQQSLDVSFNGDDALVLKGDGVILDVIGEVGFDPGNEWGSGDTSTQDNTLRRMGSIVAGDTNPDDPFDPSLEWLGFLNNTFDGLGEHSTNCETGVTPIYDIQFTDDPSGDSPLVGQVVTTTGIVYATYSGAGFAIAEAEGPWHGVFVFYPDGDLPAVGDEVEVTGEVLEFFGLTELGNFATYTVLTSGHEPYAPTAVTTADIATDAPTAESYEGVYVAVSDVTVTNPDLGFGEWEIDDSSGPARVDDLGDYSYIPMLGDELHQVQGMLYYSFGDFKLEPQDDGDIFMDPPPPPTPTHTIFEIQFTEDPSGDSPLVGQVVTTTGIVYATYPGDGFAIAEASGPWHGIYVFYPSGDLPEVGDEVVVIGEVQEFFGLTELADFAQYVVASSGHTPYTPAVVDTGQIATGSSEAESYEGVFVAVEQVTVTNPDAGFGEWFIDDGSGEVMVDDLGDYSYTPSLNELLFLVRGMLYYSFGDFKIEPRNDNDILLAPNLAISKVAPTNVDPGAVFTYELTVQNNTGQDVTDVVITDVVPANVTYQSGGMFDGVTVSWDVSSLADGANQVVSFTVSAPVELYSVVENAQYGVVASDWLTPAVGAPILTVVGDYTPIYILQGDEDASPFDEQAVETEGVVTGYFEGNYPDGGSFNGFFIQDDVGDGDPTTSDGIFVNTAGVYPTLEIGARVSVVGQVDEFGEFDETNCVETCMTQIAGLYTVIGEGSISPTILTPIGDLEEGRAYYEAHEGMLVQLTDAQTVVGPTSFGAVAVVPESLGITHAVRTGPYAGMPVEVRHYERFGDIGGGDPPDLIVGSVITNVDGPLMTSYGGLLIMTQQGDAWEVVSEAPEPTEPPTWPVPASDEFTLATFNMLNYEGSSGATKDAKVRAAIIDVLACPTFLAVQEVMADEVLPDLIDDLAAAGCPYAYGNSPSDTRGFGVAMLWRTDQVTDVSWSGDYQGCSEWADPDLSDLYDDCDGMPGQYPLFARPPIVVTATVTLDGDSMDVVVIGNHLKSQLGGDPSDYWRLDQAEFLADLVDHLVSIGSRHVVVTGDLNDFEDSDPLQALFASGNLTNTWPLTPADNQFSYIFHGVAQTLDYILVTPDLWPGLNAFGPLRINVDYPYLPYTDDPNVVWRVSDHDLLAATFSKPPQPVLSISKSVALAETPAEPGDVVTYTVVVHNSGSGDALDVLVVDTLPDGVDGEDLMITVDIAAGTSYTATLVGMVADDAPLGATIVNSASYTYNGETEMAEASFTTGLPDLTITKSVMTEDDTPQAGETITYTITVDNGGTAAAQNVTITDHLPHEVEGDDVHVTVDIPAGESYTVIIVAVIGDHAVGGTTVVNTATFDYGDQSGSASASFTVATFRLFLPIIFRQP